MIVSAARRRIKRSAASLRRGIAAASGLFLSALPASALFGTIDEVPAATLLIPYFEVQAGNRQDAHTTIFNVVNTATDSLVMAHVTLWTDLGLPTVNFTIFLQPRGSQEIDLRALFIDGALPFAGFGDSCKVLSADMPTTTRDLRAAHTGQQSDGLFSGMCGARETDDNIARGFITIDTVGDCTSLTPLSEEYFLNDTTAENVLTGHYTIRRNAPFSAVSAPAVHLEATEIPFSLETFYYRFGPIDSTEDGREPLSVTSWTASYNNPLTDVICWTDKGLNNPFACESPPLLESPPITVFDHLGEEDYNGVSGLCTLSTTKLTVGEMIPQVVAKSGKISIELNPSEVAVLSGSGGFTPRRQSYVSTIQRLHPLDLAVHVPGSAETSGLVVPFLVGEPR